VLITLVPNPIAIQALAVSKVEAIASLSASEAPDTVEITGQVGESSPLPSPPLLPVTEWPSVKELGIDKAPKQKPIWNAWKTLWNEQPRLFDEHRCFVGTALELSTAVFHLWQRQARKTEPEILATIKPPGDDVCRDLLNAYRKWLDGRR
jgi:hypothetical protein